MADPSPTSVRHAVAIVCMTAAVAAIVLGPASPGAAEPKPTKATLKAELRTLNKQVDKLISEYGAKRAELAEARKAERAAKKRLQEAEAAYEKAKREVGDIAQLRYQVPDPSVMGFMFGQDMNSAAMLEQMAAAQAAHLATFARARDARKKAAEQAAALADKIERQAADVERRREEAEKLIKQVERKLDKLVPTAAGRRSDGTWAPQLPTGSDNITPRTRLMRDEIKERFDLSFPVGCYRPGTSGEHPLGRACDFMLSSGGTMPSREQLALGDRIAEWAIANADKLGVKYVIYKQRIYNMSFPGWRAMADRGSITQNHWDHVHISMH